ncbi:unnamed protein product [Lymnaea stagnalis]|uniref:UBA domain-containing protein n=1 Tax=Lymnaea stagnalis TaxID=6523 RepID=A0AAV2ILT4_LYMST
MAANILENIQLKVKDVHIRYEDDKMNPSCPFACGVIIKNLSVQSTDATWASKFVSHNEEDVMFKLVDLKDFGIYCDTNVTMVGDLPMSDLADVLEREMYLSTSGKFQQHEYILQPITAQGKVNRNTSAMPLRSATSPRIFVELTLGDMSFSLSTEQYQCYNLWQREFARHGRQRKFRKERPNCSVSSSPRKWWHFTQEVHLARIQDRNDRLTKKFILDRAHLVAVYARIYTAYLRGETLTVQQKSTKTSIEEELEFDELKLIREATFFKLKKNSQVVSVSVYNLAAKKSPPPSETSPTQPKESGSLFQHWFPGWSGWTQSTVTPQPVMTPSPTDLGSIYDSTLVYQCIALQFPEQEIQDVIKDSSENSSFLRKDTVFARMAFLLKKGSFQLKEKHISDKAQSHSLVELHCSTIEMQFESRPRTSAMKFSLAVGSLYVQDQTAKNPTFTYIICPQVKDPLCRTAFNPVSQFVNPQNISLLARDSEGMEFFKLSYEKNPTAIFKYSVSIKTQPLDIIYTPELLRKLKDFFSTPATGLSRTASSGIWQFDKLRKQTQEELRNTLDQLLEGKASKWNINLDISAPKLIIPESVLDQNPQLVVIDLGNFRVNTVTSQSDISDQLKQKAKLREDDGEDKFETPLSTPPNETEEDEEVKKTMAGGVFSPLKKPKSSESLTEDSAENMYRIGLTEVQVLLGRLNDNWKHAYAKGTSLMHVVDRFNISVMLESPVLDSSKQFVEDNKMVVLQFLINNMSLEVQSQGQALIELQVTGVQADVHLKPLSKSLVLTVHSLLLVDALQTYGRDFELLVASHKNVILDSRSGSIKGSEFNSPSSPQSPSSPASPGSPSPDLPTSISFSSFQSIQDAISNAFHSVLPQAPTPQNRKSAETDTGHQFPPSDAKALIMLEYEVFTTPATVSPDCQTGEIVTTLLNLQFNSLDFIANQETLTEIMGFVNRTFPKKSSSGLVNTPAANSNVDNTGHSKASALHCKSVCTLLPTAVFFFYESNQVKDVVQVNADFKRLNVMMVKFLSWDNHKIARKVATATVSSAKLQVKYGEAWDLEGSLGGLHLLDVTPDGTLYQQVVSIGQFQEVDPSSEMYQTAMDDKVFSEYSLRSSQPRKNACTFFISQRRQLVHPQDTDNIMLDVPTSDHEPLEAQFDMAALTYIHCPKFLEQLLDCASEFRDYMTKVASSIKTAATEVAMGIVGVRGDKDGSAADASLAGYAIRRDQSLGDITNTILLEDISQQQGSPSVKVNKLMILINARMESPILVIPRTPNSPQVLLAHLGEIVIDNSSMMNVPSESGRGHFRGQNQDLITLSLTNMNLYSLHLGQQVTVTTTGLNSSKLSELTQKFGVPILYDTSVDLTIGKRELDNPFINPDVSSDSDVKFEDELSVSSLLDIKANISSPIKLSLSKEVYEQILQTVDNLTYDAEPAKKPNQSPSSPQNHTAMGKSERNQGAHSYPDEPGSGGSFLAKHVEFDVPLFEIELRGDFGDGERGLVDLKLYDFSVQYEKNDRACTRINLHLKSLQMDDLLEPVDSKHRQIIVSRPSKSKDVQPKALMSKSCPDSTIVAPIPRMPPSLPSSFIDSWGGGGGFGKLPFGGGKSGLGSDCPYTPPPSPAAREPIVTQQRRPDDLVHIDVTLVDKKRPEYVTKYNKTNRFINIDFACLDATINLQTWVVLLDFLGLGAKVHGVKVGEEIIRMLMIVVAGDKDDVNSDINFQVESFTLIFNKPDYELAQATAANLRMHMIMRDGDLKASGQLGSLSLLDQSPNGQLYRQRFVSTGRQVVEFNFFKYGLPDLDLQRAFDISLSLRMSSVRYIHTNRFQAEMVAFAQHFLQLQDLLGRQRAASIGKKINETATRASRILLDIEAVSPILLIPHSSKTNAVLVADLGNLKLTNHFIVDGQPGTLRAKREAEQSKVRSYCCSTAGTSAALQKGIVHRSMADNMVNESHRPARPIDPMTQSVYGSFDADERFEGFDPSGFDVPSSQSKAQPSIKRNFSQSYPNQRHTVGEGGEDGDDHRCLLDVISVTLSEMDLFTAKRICKSDYQGGDLSTDMEFSTFVLEREHGKLLKEKCQLELHIERNLEGDVSHTAPDFCINGKLSSVDCHLDIGQYELIRGILNHNLGERLEEFQRPLMSHLQDPRIQTVLGGKPWKGISLIIDLRNVTVELLHSHKLGPDVPERSLSRLDFIRSQLSVSSYSNQLKEVDLVSNEIKIYDTRFKFEPVNARPNVFTSILQPSSGSKDRKGLQMEMHLRLGPDSSHFTLLLNNVRLMCVFDWLLAMKEYISREPPNPFAKVLSLIHRLLSLILRLLSVIHRCTDETSCNITAVIIYKPQCHERILSCSLQNVELFSCCLMAEDDTALSIIDPTTLTIELNANPLPQHDPCATGLLGLKDAQRRHLVLEVVLKPLNIRVSYHDIVMFLAILNSLPQQALQAQQQQATANSASTESTPHQAPPPPAALAGQVNEEVLRLLDLGFPESDVRRALAASSWDLDKAALWLTENGKHMSPKKAAEPAPSSASFGQDLLTDIELSAESIVLCLIDDCGDADIPLAEISCNSKYIMAIALCLSAPQGSLIFDFFCCCSNSESP